jgi:quercetin dioxygenase-like cupin family protein
MAIHHATSGEIIDIRPLGAALAKSITTVLVKTAAVEVIRLVVPAGKDIPEHRARGEITIQCLEGAVDLTAEGRTQRIAAGQMVYLAAGSTHSLHGVQDASVLLTVSLREQPKGG